jgi:hypothetical protein
LYEILIIETWQVMEPISLKNRQLYKKTVEQNWMKPPKKHCHPPTSVDGG